MKYIGLGILLLLVLAQVNPIYLIASELIQDQAGANSTFLVGKLTGHLFIIIIVILISLRLLKK